MPETWTNASTPPDTSRTVRVLMCNGDTETGYYRVEKQRWFLLEYGVWWKPCEPAGWRELTHNGDGDA